MPKTKKSEEEKVHGPRSFLLRHVDNAVSNVELRTRPALPYAARYRGADRILTKTIKQKYIKNKQTKHQDGTEKKQLPVQEDNVGLVAPHDALNTLHCSYSLGALFILYPPTQPNTPPTAYDTQHT